MVVTTTWLAAHRNDPNLAVLAVGDKSEYAKAHIPGSLYLDYHDMSAQGGLTLELPPMAELAETFGKLGVTDDSRIVLYTIGNGSTQTARVYLTLDAMGLGARSSILDGGLPIWQEESRSVTTEVRAVKPGKIAPCAQTDVIASLDYVRANLRHAGIDIVDARDPQFYTGASVSRNRAGHIAGATSIPYGSLLDEKGKLKPAEMLQQQFRAAGVKTGDQIVAYCHIGQQASLLYFVSRYLGYDVRLYDGSWEEWARHPELPAEMVQK
jgi:thiosulfate/3-mercaptopyruvate sulfurtransferase